MPGECLSGRMSWVQKLIATSGRPESSNRIPYGQRVIQDVSYVDALRHPEPQNRMGHL